MAARELSPSEVQRWTRVGVLSALALLLSYAETFVPIPIPGVKLGLANIAVLVALVEKDVSGAFCISCIKVLATGLLFGSPLTMAYSAVGTLLAFAGMAPLSQLKSMHVVMVSIVGAILHEIGQLVVASVLLGTTAVWYTAPVLLVAGCITGALCGTLASRLKLSSKPCEPAQQWSPVSHLSTISWQSKAVLAFALVSMLVVFHLRSIPILAGAATALLAVCAIARVKPKTLLDTMRPMVVIAVLTFTAQLIATPQNAVEETARAMLRLLCVASLCLIIMKRVPTTDLTATVAHLVRPLERIGIRTQGFVLAFDVAVRLLPTIIQIADTGSVSLRDFPTLIPRAYEQLVSVAGQYNEEDASL